MLVCVCVRACITIKLFFIYSTVIWSVYNGWWKKGKSPFKSETLVARHLPIMLHITDKYV